MSEEGSVHLDDGRELLLAHVMPEAGTRAGEAGWNRRLAAWLEGQRVSWKAAGDPDRWGRVPAHLFIREPDGDLPAFWLQAGLVHHGHAALWPHRMPQECLRQLRAEEDQAIARKRGRWAHALQMETLAAIRMQGGRATTGQRIAMVLQVKDTRRWHDGAFVNFMPSFHGGPSVFLTSRQVEALRNAQRDPYSWQGRRILMRAVVNDPDLRKLRVDSIDQLLPID